MHDLLPLGFLFVTVLEMEGYGPLFARCPGGKVEGSTQHPTYIETPEIESSRESKSAP